jgi:acyl carrier protein
MSTAPADVEQTIKDFLIRIEKLPEALTPELPLYADGIGLDSLETAELSAILEDDHGADPFAGAEMPQTVGDILAFYAA